MIRLAFGDAMAGMVPYVVQRGDYLLKIALRMGFVADTVWNDPKNADLRAARPDMHVLCVGDVLYVPDKPRRAWHPLSVGSSNKFKAKVPTVHSTSPATAWQVLE